MFSTPLNSASEINGYIQTDANGAVPPALDTSRAPYGQPGSARFTVAITDGATSGELRIPFISQANGIREGQSVYVHMRQYMTPEFAHMVCPLSDYSSMQGYKQLAISGSQTHQLFSLVLENGRADGIVNGYVTGPTGFEYQYWEQAFGGSDFKSQPVIDNSVPATTSDDSIYASVNAGGAIDPDTGGAYSAAQIEYARYGGTYHGRINDAAYAPGVGQPLSGAERWKTGEFGTVVYGVTVGNWNQSNSRLRCWYAQEGKAPVLLVDRSDIRLALDGSNPADVGLWIVWPLPYYTNRISGGRSVSSRTSNITGVTIAAIGLGTAVGAGTLSWNATTKRFTWAESGGSAGTARGVNAYKSRVNVFTSGGTNSFQSGKFLGLIVDWASLPGTNQTDTVTIAGTRAEVTTNVSEIIVDSSPPNVTAYNAAGVRVGPVGGYPCIPPTTALGTYISAMTPGTWSPASNAGGGFAMPTLTQAMITGGDVGSILEYTMTGAWDSVNKRALFCGTTHDNLHYSGFIRYTDSSNAWDSPTSPLPTPSTTHAYQQNCVSQYGDLFYRLYQQANVKVFPSATQVWANVSTPDPVNAPPFLPIVTQIWNPAANGGVGEMRCVSGCGVSAYRYTPGSPASGTWVTLSTAQLLAPESSYYYSGFHDPVSGSDFVFYSGNTSQAIRITAAGVVSVVTISGGIPHAVGAITSDGPLAVAVDGWVTPGGVVRRPLLIWGFGGTGMWEFHSETLSFTSLGVTPPAMSAAAGAYFPVPTYDAVMQMNTSGGVVPFTYLFRRTGASA